METRIVIKGTPQEGFRWDVMEGTNVLRTGTANSQPEAFIDHTMTIEIGNVQRVYKGILRLSGWGFTLRDTTIQPAQFVTITYKTESEAEYAKKTNTSGGS